MKKTTNKSRQKILIHKKLTNQYFKYLKRLKRVFNVYLSSISILGLLAISGGIIFFSELNLASADSASIGASKDAWISQKSSEANDNHGDDDKLRVKSKSNNENRRVLVAFDLSSLPDSIVIDSATLKLFMNKAPGSSRTYGAHLITASWAEDTVNWNTIATSFNASSTDEIATGEDDNEFLLWDVKPDVQEFVGGSTSNNGWMIKDKNESNGSDIKAELKSKEYGGETPTETELSRRPELEITYHVPEPQGSISGYKFNDLNGNGEWDENEPGLSGWIINLGGDGNDQDTTDEDGHYVFGELIDGDYTVCEVLPEDYKPWIQTKPSGGVGCPGDTNGYFIEISDGNEITHRDFGNVQYGSITIIKNTNSEGVGPGDAEGFTFTLNGSNSQVVFSGGEPYVYENLVAGTYTVQEIIPAGWILDSVECLYNDESTGESTENGEVVILDAGKDITCTFTNTKLATFTLDKISDPVNGSFQFDLTGPSGDNSSVNSTTFNPSGTWNLNNLFPGLYSLLETVLSPEEWTGSQIIACNGNGDNDPFGSVASFFEFMLDAGDDMSCVVNNTQDALITGKKFEDVDADGIVGDDSGRSGWTITATRIDTEADPVSTVTTDNGDYMLRVQPGTYRICETLEGDWYQSYPTESTTSSTLCGDDGRGYELTVAAADNINGKDFGNYQNGSISGVKWEDFDADGEYDEDNEEVLDGWTIFLDLNDNGVLDENEPSRETGDEEEGFYSFENLTPGAYVVREVLQAGWTQKFPGTDTDSKHTVVVTSGEEEQNWNFGNFKLVTITGFKWDDGNGDGIWQKGEGQNPDEPGLQDITVALGRVNGESRQENGQEVIPIEIIALSLTGVDGGFVIHDVGPGHYKLFEENRSGWQATNPAPRLDSFFDITYHINLQPQQKPLVPDSFFDVFAEFSGQNVNQSKATYSGLITVPSVPLEFGNHRLLVISEKAVVNVEQTSVVINWMTDHPGTSRVVYDTVSHSELGSSTCSEPNESLSCYGYANTTAVFDTDPKVTNHSVAIGGLTPGTTYFFRTISTASPESVSGEFSGTTSGPSLTPTPTPTPENNSGGGGGGGGGGTTINGPGVTSTPTPLITSTDSGQVPTSTPTLTLTPIPSATPRLNVAIAGTDVQTNNSGGESNLGVPEETSIGTEQLSLENQKTPASTLTSQGLLAVIGNIFLGDMVLSYWWLIIVLILTIIFMVISRHHKKHKN